MNFAFRCDATAEIGFGHLSRCIALAEALRVKGCASNFIGQFDDAATEMIALAGFEHSGLLMPIGGSAPEDEKAAVYSEPDVQCVVVDSYRADPHYLAHLTSFGVKTVVIDDFCKLNAYPCDIVLNFTWEAPQLTYPAGPAFVLGHKNLLVRRRLVEQREASIQRARSGAVRNLLIAIGGSDPKGLASRILRLLPLDDDELCVRIVTPQTPELAEILSAFAEGSGCMPRQPDLSDALLWADAAITGGGLIKYESAYMGVPVAAIAQNEGQDGETKVFKQAGLVSDLGLADSVTDDELARDLAEFLSDNALREDMIVRAQKAFVPDPAMYAANQLLEALKA